MRGFLRHLPVAINCYYGDPALQWGDTVAKLERLAEVGHLGPVGVITKGALGPQRCRQLAALYRGLPGLVVLMSISGLGREFEGCGHRHRYRGLENLREAGVPHLAAVRPLVPPHNTSPAVLRGIFDALQVAGCETACVSGFRGNEALIEAMDPDDQIAWVLRVKQMTGFDLILKIARERGVRLFTRIACAISVVTGRTATYNPYWGSPQLVRCAEIGCPIRESCGPVSPDPEALSWLKGVGYDLKDESSCDRALCRFTADNRLRCQSCCTTCFVQQQPRVVVRNAETLGDLAFCRFVLGGTLCVRPGMIDSGHTDVGHVKVLNRTLGIEAHAINSWWVWARRGPRCFDCRYCISTLYPGSGEVGLPPEEVG